MCPRPVFVLMKCFHYSLRAHPFPCLSAPTSPALCTGGSHPITRDSEQYKWIPRHYPLCCPVRTSCHHYSWKQSTPLTSVLSFSPAHTWSIRYGHNSPFSDLEYFFNLRIREGNSGNLKGTTVVGILDHSEAGGSQLLPTKTGQK